MITAAAHTARVKAGTKPSQVFMVYLCFLHVCPIRLVRPVPPMEVNCAISYVRGTVLLDVQDLG